MIVFRVLDVRGFSGGNEVGFEFSTNDMTSGVVRLHQFQQERFSLNLNPQDRSILVLVNPSPGTNMSEGRIDIPITNLAPKRTNELEFSVPNIRGGEGALKVSLQIVDSLVVSCHRSGRILSISETRILAFQTRQSELFSSLPRDAGGAEKTFLIFGRKTQSIITCKRSA